MEHFGVPFDAPPPDFTPPQDPFSRHMTAPAFEEETENQDEWEYEYSTTETETYYLTLDLTTPNIPPRRKARPNGGKSRKMRWLNPGLGRQKRGMNLDEPRSFTFDPGDDKEREQEEQSPEPELEDEREEEEEEFSGGSKAEDLVASTEDKESLQLPKVQILELHSKNPLISYDGHVYSCEWASNIGTEMIFTSRIDDEPLPHLRALPGGIDLLAASSARLISENLNVERTGRDSRPSKEAQRHRGQPIIPVGSAASAKRKDQASFLERLIQLKEKKGEGDFVTVNAHRRKLNTGWKAVFKARRQEERQRLQRLIKKGDQEVAEYATDRLQEMDREDEERRKAIEGKRARKKQGRKRNIDEIEGSPGDAVPKKKITARKKVDVGSLVARSKSKGHDDTLDSEGEIDDLDDVGTETLRRNKADRLDEEDDDLDEDEDEEAGDEDANDEDEESGEEISYDVDEAAYDENGEAEENYRDLYDADD